MLADLRLAYRRLVKAPGFTIVAVTTLALGLSVNIAAFGMISEFMLRPLRVPDPERLVFVMQRNPKMNLPVPFPISYPDYLDMRDSLAGARAGGSTAGQLFSGVLAYIATPVHVSQGGRLTERVWAHEVSANYFDVLGVQPAQGQLFLPGEGVNAGADPIAVLAHRYWIERFAGNSAILGQPIEVNGVPLTVVGVAPKDFGGAEAMTTAQLFVPATMNDRIFPQRAGAVTSRGNASFMVVGRMRPGVSAEQARAAVDVLLQRLIAEYPDDHAPAQAIVIPERQSRPSPFVSTFTPLALGALTVLAVLVLAVAAANIANLLFARAAEDERSLAIRTSLGATRLRLVRQQLAETVLIALAAGVVGLYASDLLGVLLQSIGTSADNPPPAPPGSPWPRIAFTAAAAVVAGVATSLLPALRATRLDMLSVLKEAGPTVSRARHPLRSLLVVGQVALSCVVLICAGLAVRSLHVLSTVDLGFQPENVLVASFDLEMQRYSDDRARQFHDALLHEVRALPGVRDAALARSVPFEIGTGLRGGIGAEGQPAPERDEVYLVATVPAGAGFLETLRIPILTGRPITEPDDENAPPVAVINQAVAQHFWPGQDPLGKRLTFGGNRRLVEVVGVTGDIRYFMMTDRNRPVIFLPLAQSFSPNVALAIRAEGAPVRLARPIEQIARRLDPGLTVSRIRTLEEQITSSPLGLMPLRLGATVAGIQGTLVLVLAVIGLYGLVSFAVSRRTREIGVRRALGATQRDVLVLVTRPSLVLTGVGLVVGLAIAAVITLPLAGLLYGIAPHDPIVFGGVTVLLVGVTTLAAWAPARRATRVNPIEALRVE